MSMVITPWLQTKFNLETLDVNHLEGLIKGAIIIAAVLIQRGRKAL
jgi:ribose/xylose/arabinose/galactoside ABC-type transport system permease subunit